MMWGRIEKFNLDDNFCIKKVESGTMDNGLYFKDGMKDLGSLNLEKVLKVTKEWYRFYVRMER